MRHPFAYFALAGAVAACAPLLDIEEATCDPASAACASTSTEVLPNQQGTNNDAGAVVEPPTPCEEFCERADDACPDDSAAYTSGIVCRRVCELYSESELECRARELDRARDLSEPATHCPAASIAGTRNDGSEACDTGCGAYCRLLAMACPEGFDPNADNPLDLPVYDDEAACEAACRDEIVEVPRGFSVRDRTGDTLQCRLWHLAQAAVDPVHCGHARGDCPCGEEATCNATLEQ